MSVVIPEDIVIYCKNPDFSDVKEGHVTVSEWLRLAEKNHRHANLWYNTKLKYQRALTVLKTIAEFNADDAENKASDLCRELLEELGECNGSPQI